MGVILIDGNTYSLNNLEWEEKKGTCDWRLCQPFRDCNCPESKRRCISQLTGHACKHFVKAEENEQKVIDKLLISENICNPEEDRNKAINITSSDTSNDVRDKNDAVKDYEELCRRSEAYITCGWLSKNNIQLACGDKYKGYTTILNTDNRILSFYYSKKLEKNSFEELSDYYMYSLVSKSINHNHQNNYSIIEGGKPLEGGLFYEFNGGIGIGSKIDYAFSFRGESKEDILNIHNVLFKYHYDPEVAKVMIELYEALSMEENLSKPSTDTVKLIKSNQKHILTMLKLQKLEHYNRDKEFSHSYEERVYSAAYGQDENHRMNHSMISCIQNVLKKDLLKEYKELEKDYRNSYYGVAIHQNNDETEEVIKKDILAFEVVRLEQGIILLGGLDVLNYSNFEDDETIMGWRNLLRML